MSTVDGERSASSLTAITPGDAVPPSGTTACAPTTCTPPKNCVAAPKLSSKSAPFSQRLMEASNFHS